PASALKSAEHKEANSEYRQPVSIAPCTRLRNAGSQALTSRTHSASERYRTRAVSTARKGLTRRQASSLATWPDFQAWFNAAFRTVRIRFAVARRLRMPSALLSIL